MHFTKWKEYKTNTVYLDREKETLSYHLYNKDLIYQNLHGCQVTCSIWMVKISGKQAGTKKNIVTKT